jgi:hypothetical protein
MALVLGVYNPANSLADPVGPAPPPFSIVFS